MVNCKKKMAMNSEYASNAISPRFPTLIFQWNLGEGISG